MVMTTIVIDSSLAAHIQPGEMIEIEITLTKTYPQQRIVRTYRVMTVDRINELVDCNLVDEQEV